MAAPLTDDELDALIPSPNASAASAGTPASSGQPLVNESQPPGGDLGDEEIAKLIPSSNAPKRNEPSLVGDVLRGIDNLQSLGGGLVSLLGNATGMQDAEDWGMEVYHRNEAQAQQNPAAIGSYENIHGGGDLLRYAAEAVLENLPMFVPSLVSGGIGGMVAKKTAETYVRNLAARLTEEQVAKLVAKRIFIGSTAGAFGSSWGMEAGSIFGDVKARTGEEDPGTAILYGAGAGALDALPEGALITSVLGPAKGGKLLKGLVKRVGAEGAKQFLFEAPTELTQTIIEEAAVAKNDPSMDLFSEEQWKKYIDAGLKGGLAGAAMGGASGAYDFMKAHHDATVREAEQDIENRANDQSDPIAEPEQVTPADERLSAITQERASLDEEYAAEGVTDQRKGEIDARRALLDAEESATMATGEAAPPTLVNENNTPPPQEGTEGSVVGFQTAKGSTYTIQPDGTTVRNKAARPDVGHEGDSGIKEASAATFYLDEDSANALSRPEGSTRLFVHDDGTLSMLWKNPQTGRWGVSPSAKNVKASAEPKEGMMPLEVWQEDDIGITGGKAYRVTHFGNPIVSLTRNTPAPKAQGQAATGFAKGEKVKFSTGYAGEVEGEVVAVPGEEHQGAFMGPDSYMVRTATGGTTVAADQLSRVAATPSATAAPAVAPSAPKAEAPKAQSAEETKKTMQATKRLALEEERAYLQSADDSSGIDAQERNGRIREIDAALVDDQALDTLNDSPTYAFTDATDLPNDVTREGVEETRTAAHAVIETLVNESTTPESQARYKGTLKAAVDRHLNLLTGEKVKVKKAPRGESFGVNATRSGGIELWIPSQQEFDARNKRQAKRGGLADTLENTSKLLEEEIIHVAHYSFLREKWEKGGKKGAFDEYVNKRMSELGRWLKSSTRSLPDELANIYQPGAGAAPDFTLGTEFMRMMVQRARTGQLTEDASIAANVVLRGGATSFLRGLLNAAQRIREVIARYLNPETSTPAIQGVYRSVNEVLDRYGDVKPQPLAPSQRPANPDPIRVTQARELGEPPALVATPEEDAENYTPERSEQEEAARRAAHARINAQPSDDRQAGITPEIRERLQKQVRAARDHIDRKDNFATFSTRDAAKTHAQIEMARGNRLTNREARSEAKQKFETTLQRKVTQQVYDEAIDEAREEPLRHLPPPPKAKRANRRPLRIQREATPAQTQEQLVAVIAPEATPEQHVEAATEELAATPVEVIEEAIEETMQAEPEPVPQEQPLVNESFEPAMETAPESAPEPLQAEVEQSTPETIEAPDAVDRFPNLSQYAVALRGQVADFAEFASRVAAELGEKGRQIARALWRHAGKIIAVALSASILNMQGNVSPWVNTNQLADLVQDATAPSLAAVAITFTPDTIAINTEMRQAALRPDQLTSPTAFQPSIPTAPGLISPEGPMPVEASPLSAVDQWKIDANETYQDEGEVGGFKKETAQEHTRRAAEARARQQRGESLDAVDHAYTFLGEREGKNKNIQKILNMFSAGTNQDAYPWCAPFVSYCLTRGGAPTHQQSARALLKSGAKVSLADAQEGDVVVMWNENPATGGRNGWGGHAGLFLAREGDFVQIIGGNQGDEVSVAWVHESRVLGVRHVHSPTNRLAVSRRSPEMEELEGAVHANLDKIFSPNVLVNEKQRTIKQGGRIRFGNFTPMELSVLSQPKEPSFFAAKDFFDSNGSILDNANFLLRNPEVANTPLSGAERTAFYKIVMLGLDHLRTDLWENPEAFVSEDADAIEETISKLDIQYANFGTEVGRIGSSMTDLLPFIGGRRAAKDYSTAILQQWKRRFGKKGMEVVEAIRSKMNAVARKAMDGIVTRAESVAFFRRVLSDLEKKEWRKAMRATIANESKKMNGIARRAASRAAEIEFGNLESEPALQEAARRILGDITFGIPKPEGANAAEEASTILSQALSQVTREVARETGAIPERARGQRVTDLQKLSEIIQSPELYDAFVLNIEERLSSRFAAANPNGGFFESINDFVGRMRRRTWMDGLIEKVIADKAKEMNVSIQKAAKKAIGEKTKVKKLGQTSYQEGLEEIAKLREALVNEMEGQGLSAEAIASIAEDVNSMLNDSVEKARELWAGSPGAVRKTLQQIGQTVNRVAKQGFHEREQTTQNLTAQFIERLGLANTPDFPHARRLQEIIQRQLAEMVTDERQRIIDSVLRNADPEVRNAAKRRALSRGQTTAIDRIIQMANVGALTDEKVYGALAEKLGLPQYSEAEAAKIQEWGERIGDMREGREKIGETTKLRDYIESRKGVTWQEMLTAGMYASMLSGPSTHLVNIVSNTLNLMGKLWVETVLHPTRFPAMMRALTFSLTRGGQLEFRETISSGIGHKLNVKVDGGNPLEYTDPIYLDRGAEYLGAILAPKSPWMPKAKYVVRFLQGADMMFYKAAQAVDFAARGYDGSGEAWAARLTEARNEFARDGRDADSRAGRRALELRALELLEQGRVAGDAAAALAWKEAHGEALNTTFNQEPKGWIGKFARMIGEYSEEHKFAKLFVPFTRVVANVLNAQIDWSPFGISRWALSKEFRLEDVDGSMRRDPKILVRALTSMVVLGALGAMLMQYDDDEDPYFTIYGSGPKDANKKRQLYERGWKPNTIKVGKTYVSYLTTPMSLSFASIGTLMDRHREGSGIGPIDSIPQLGIAFVQGTLNQSFLSGVADLFGAFESANPEQGVQRFIARTLTLPIPNLARQIDAWADPSVQQSENFLQMVLKQIPVARHALKPMLNVFGQAVEKTPGPMNIPFGNRFVTVAPEDDPVFSFLGQHALTVPNYSKQTKLGDERMTEDQYYKYVQTAGPLIHSAIRREIPLLRGKSKEDKQERIDRIAQNIKRDVRDRMKASSR